MYFRKIPADNPLGETKGVWRKKRTDDVSVKIRRIKIGKRPTTTATVLREERKQGISWRYECISKQVSKRVSSTRIIHNTRISRDFQKTNFFSLK